MEYYQRELRTQLSKYKGDNNETQSQAVDIQSFYDFKNPRPEHALGKERDNYEALCRNEEMEMSTLRQSKLKCRYIGYHPLLKIAPVKEELVYDEPPIWVYHDVITDKQIDIMKNLAFPRLKRAIVRSPVTGNYETANYRISQRYNLNFRVW
jgi:hypothetical protein